MRTKSLTNSPFTYYPQNQGLPPSARVCIHHEFTKIAHKQPQSEAMNSHDGNFDYQALDDESSFLAYELLRASKKTGKVIPICFEHSKWAIVAMLAVLKVGRAFCPLPSSPPSRIETILQQLPDTDIILSSQQRRGQLSKINSNIWTIPLDGHQFRDRQNVSLPLVTPDDLANILFTSGSTGVPKGVLIEHQQLSSFIHHYNEQFKVGPRSRSLQFSAYTFDGCMMEIFGPLSAGGCVCIPSEEGRLSDLPATISSFTVSHAFLVPSVLRSVSPDELQLEHLLMGGEPSTPEFVRRWGESSCSNFYHVYGPTECCVLSSVLPVKSSLQHNSVHGSGNIGFPSLIGCRGWIVDPNDPNTLQLPDEEGEILIEGPAVARGYLNNASATTQKFISNPTWLKEWRNSPGRLYRTGDIGRCGSDGSITYLGRKDTQVKIDGQRTELGEIECYLRTILTDQPEAVVDLIQVSSTSPVQIVCFMESTHNESTLNTRTQFESTHILDTSETKHLRSLLVNQMPSHMVPSHFLIVDKIPRFASFKIDRQCLKNHAVSCLKEYRKALIQQSTPVSPVSSNESILHELWCSILNVVPSSLGVHDDFFELGGSSALAMELIALLRKRGLSLSLKDVFEHSLLSRMASRAKLEASNLCPDPPTFSLLPELRIDEIIAEVLNACRVDREDIKDIYPVSDRCEAAMTSTEFDPSNGQFSRGLFITSEIFAIPTTVSSADYIAAWKKVIQTFDIFRTRVVKSSFGLVEVVLKNAGVIESGRDLNAQLSRERSRTMSYGEPLNCFAVVTSKDQEHFMWTSKMLFDAWTIRLVLKALNSSLDGENIGNPAKITHLIRFRQTADFSEATRYFKSQFDGSNFAPIFQVTENYVPSATSTTLRDVGLPRKVRTGLRCQPALLSR